MLFLKKIIHYSLYLFPIYTTTNQYQPFHSKIIAIALDDKYKIPDECLHITNSKDLKIYYLDHKIDQTILNIDNPKINPLKFNFYQYSRWKKWHSNPSLTTLDFLKYSYYIENTLKTLIEYGSKQDDPIYLLLPYFWLSPDLVHKYDKKDVVFLISPLQKYGDYKYILEYDILKNTL
jgi:hypothetical protein